MCYSEASKYLLEVLESVSPIELDDVIEKVLDAVEKQPCTLSVSWWCSNIRGYFMSYITLHKWPQVQNQSFFPGLCVYGLCCVVSGNYISIVLLSFYVLLAFLFDEIRSVLYSKMSYLC